jgi:hypothetical protein
MGTWPAHRKRCTAFLPLKKEERRCIASITPYPDFSLEIHFADGWTKHVDLRPCIQGGLSRPLGQWDFFRQVAIDTDGGLVWPNGYDFCPNFLHDEVPTIQTA